MNNSKVLKLTPNFGILTSRHKAKKVINRIISEILKECRCDCDFSKEDIIKIAESGSFW